VVSAADPLRSLKNKQTPWLSVGKRIIPTERLPKLVPTFVGRGCCVVRPTDPTVVNHGFILFLPGSFSIILMWLSELRSGPTTSKKKNRISLEIEPGTSGSVARNFDHYIGDT
jgi:hypothetical protein